MAGTLSYRKQPFPNYLVGNPIVFELESTENDLIYFDVVIQGVVIYSGTFIPTQSGAFYEANISISDIVKSYMQTSKIENTSLLVSPVSNPYLRVAVLFNQNNSALNYSGRVFNGGIGKKMLRYLKEKNSDIFSYKFLNTDKQFFLTTRTSGRHIVVKENELSPLFFVATDKAYSVVTEFGNVFTFPAMTNGDLYAFNMETLRQLSYDAYNRIPSYVGFLIDGKYVFDITIKEPARSPNKYIIQFLNSFSAFEKLEVTGKSVSEPEFAEDNAFSLYDSIVDDYIEQNNRLAIRETITADFGYKTLEEFFFMRDMLQSDKRILFDQSGNSYEARISVDNFSHDLVPTEPGSVQLKIRMIESDVNYSPEIDESLPDFNFGEAIWLHGVTNGYGFLFADSKLNTI